MQAAFVEVNEAYTTQSCPRCGCINDGNRARNTRNKRMRMR
ncbi:transposase [Candidatus Nitrosoglobus terrae]|nr:transposase [Candidatus Nitrosoglobus terrae]